MATAVQIPVEIVSEGSPPHWIYVEVQNPSVPEPGITSLIAVAGLLLLRRKRAVAEK